MKPAVIVFAKAPLPGLAKTRLAPALGAPGAAALAARLLRHAVQQAMAAGLGPVEICCAPDAGHALFAELAQQHGLALTLQGEGDLGQRMDRAFRRVLGQGLQGQGALLMGADAPALDAARLRQAAAALARSPAVFVPALDGGYALVGLRQPAPCCFEDMAWSTPQVMQHTRRRLQAAGLGWAELAPVSDIDEPADLHHLPAGWLPAAPARAVGP
jgi:rSAM/selenodomain-associated transferase 1